VKGRGMRKNKENGKELAAKYKDLDNLTYDAYDIYVV
jgi:hypothetical protein